MSNRTQKQSARHATNITHQRLRLDDDYEVVQSRTASLQWNHNTASDSPRDKLRGQTTWTVGDSWGPEDDPEFALDKSSQRHDDELEQDIGKVLDKMEPKKPEKIKKARSEASVGIQAIVKYHLLTFFRHDPGCIGKETIERRI